MKKLLIGLLSLCTTVLVFGKDYTWKIEEVINNNHNIVGYIYHTEVVGTQIGIKPEKVITSLRLVCSTIGIQNNDKLVVLYWETLNENSGREITVSIDNVGVETKVWNQVGTSLIRTVPDSQELINLLKTRKNIKFSWNDSGITGTTMFDLTTFKLRLDEFNSQCRTPL